MNIDYDFINVFKIPVLAGSAYDKSNYSDSAEIIINAKAALVFGFPLDSVINRKSELQCRYGQWAY